MSQTLIKWLLRQLSNGSEIYQKFQKFTKCPSHQIFRKAHLCLDEPTCSVRFLKRDWERSIFVLIFRLVLGKTLDYTGRRAQYDWGQRSAVVKDQSGKVRYFSQKDLEFEVCLFWKWSKTMQKWIIVYKSFFDTVSVQCNYRPSPIFTLTIWRTPTGFSRQTTTHILSLRTSGSTLHKLSKGGRGHYCIRKYIPKPILLGIVRKWLIDLYYKCDADDDDFVDEEEEDDDDGVDDQENGGRVQ